MTATRLFASLFTICAMPLIADAAPDEDGDGVPNAADNCPTVPNPAQTDANGDGHGDDCVDPAAALCASVVLGYGVIIGANVTIDCFSRIGDRSVIGGPGPAPVTIGAHTRVGARTEMTDGVEIGHRVRIGKDGRLDFGTRVGHGTRVGARARLSSADVGPGCTLGHDVDLHDSPTVGPGVTIGNGSTVIGPLVVEAGVRIGNSSFVGEGSTLRAFSRIGDDAGLPLGTQLGAFSVVGDGFSGQLNINIGSHVTIGPRVTFRDVTLRDFVTVGADTSMERGIELGHHSEVGSDVTIDLFDVDYPPFTVIPDGTTLP